MAPVSIQISLWNVVQRLKRPRRGALMFFKVICLTSRSCEPNMFTRPIAGVIRHDDVIKFSRYWPFARGVHRSPMTTEFPTRRPVTRSFDIVFDLRLNKQLSKQGWGWWFETPLRPLWRHYNDLRCHNTNCYSPINKHSMLYLIVLFWNLG